MTSSQASKRLAACGLPQAWAGRAAWTVLDTAFDEGQQFLAVWQAWRDDPQRPRMLHYAAIAGRIPVWTADHPLAQTLQDACYALLPGFQRITLEGGRLQLTLCVGELRTQLNEQHFLADTVLVAGEPPMWDKWAVKSLARRCQRGTRLHALIPRFAWAGALEASGFVIDAMAPDTAQGTGFGATYQPRWTISHSRQGLPATPPTPTHCVVVGAGLAGASVAHALAVRGWRVTVLDQHLLPAGGASGLPAGLVVPHVSVDDSARSRMSRVGTRLMLEQAQRHLQDGQDWCRSGVLEIRQGDKAHQPAPEFLQQSGWVQPGASRMDHGSWDAGVAGAATSLWHPHAAWIKPARLVDAWLRTPGVQFVGGAQVHTVQAANGGWRLCDAQGAELAHADRVVFANAMGCAALIERLDASPALQDTFMGSLHALQTLHGTLSRGPQAGVAPPFPVNGLGSFIPDIPGAAGPEWFAGSTFELSPEQAADLPAQHRANQQRLQQLLPAVARGLAEAFDTGRVQHWSGSRCVSHDRLPLVGPLSQDTTATLWMSAAMGARGLSFSMLCAELLAARWGGEPLPLEASLARNLDAQRVRRTRAT